MWTWWATAAIAARPCARRAGARCATCCTAKRAWLASDSMRTEEARRGGAVSADPLEAWSTNRPVGPIILIALGVFLLLSKFDWFPWYRISQFFWPLLLIGAGIWMMRNRLDRRS